MWPGSGFGIESKVALAAFIATFPIVVGTAAGLHAADENARMLFKTMGASRMQTLIKMKLPMGLPQIFTGLKIGAVGVMAGAITGEFLGGGKGFGELIRVAASQLNTPRVFSLILYLSLLGLALYALVTWTQRRVVFWQKETVGAHDELTTVQGARQRLQPARIRSQGPGNHKAFREADAEKVAGIDGRSRHLRATTLTACSVCDSTWHGCRRRLQRTPQRSRCP